MRATPVMPIETVKEIEFSIPQLHMRQTAAVTADNPTSNYASPVNFACGENIEELRTGDTLKQIMQKMLHLEEFISYYSKRCKNKTVDILALLWSKGVNTGLIVESEAEMNSFGLDLTAQHKDNLIRNLSCLDLDFDAVDRDGDCFFRAIARQLCKHLSLYREQTQQHCYSLGLGKNNEDNNTKILRQLFVKEVIENINEYKDWMTSAEDELEQVAKFKQEGFFFSEVGDLCAKATSKLLRIPIVIVTAHPTIPTIPFLPSNFITPKPIYITYDHSGPGHYDATREISYTDDGSEEVQDVETRCTCGKNRKQTDFPVSCVSFRCPCHRQKRPCIRKCRCYNCKNEKDSNVKGEKKSLRNKGCRCEIARKGKKDDSSKKSCQDGLRKSKCPCLAGETGCTDLCRNCGNIFQSRVAAAAISKPSRKRRRGLVSTYKRKPGKCFLEKENIPVEPGPWRNLEIMCLIVCQEVLTGHGISVNSKNLQLLYNFVAESEGVRNMSLLMSSKSTAQVAAKLAHLQANRTL